VGEGLADTAGIAVEFGARLLGALGETEARVLLERIEAEAAATRLVGTLNRAWWAIVTRHPELAAVTVSVAAVGEQREGSTVRPRRSAARALDADIRVSREALRGGSIKVLGALLHQAAHSLAGVRGLKVVSRQGRYHNRRFCELALEVGVVPSARTGFGWSTTSVPPTAANEYATVVADIEHALPLWGPVERQAPAPRGSPMRRRRQRHPRRAGTT